MKLIKFDNMNCPIAQSLDVIGERWTLLILRDVFMGNRQFAGIQKNLGIAKNILSSRLTHLQENGVIERRQLDGRSGEYFLTEKGFDLHTVLIALTEWGEKHRPGPDGPRTQFENKTTGQIIAPLQVRDQSGTPLSPRDIKIRPARQSS